MDFSGAGTAIMLALAAVLWFLYLLPTWVRRREYLATERNATRLQRAIRVMAETAEMPDEVRLEANAREVAQREKLLRQEQRRADAVARAEVTAAAARARAAEARAAEIERAARAVTATADRVVAQRTPSADRVAAQRTPSADRVAAQRRVEIPASAAERLRRARRVAGLLLLASVVVAAVQAWLMVSTGAVFGSWVVLAGCAAGAAASVSLQRRIVARTQALAPAASGRVVRRSASTLIDADTVAEPVREWTPVPIPKPLYLERQEAPRVPVAAPVSAEALLKAAAAEAERALAAAHAEPEVVPFPSRPAAPAPVPVASPQPSRYASMGIVDSGSGAMPDLDEVLRRRRSG